MTIIFKGHVRSISLNDAPSNRVAVELVSEIERGGIIKIFASKEELDRNYFPGAPVQIAITPLMVKP